MEYVAGKKKRNKMVKEWTEVAREKKKEESERCEVTIIRTIRTN